MTKKLLMIAHFLALGFWVGAQSIDNSLLSTSGGESEGSSITLQWTLGEIAAVTQTTEKLMLTEGFIQPVIKIIEVPDFTFTDENDFLSKDLEINLWPSPVAEYLNIQVKGQDVENISFSLYDLSGNRVLTKDIDKELDSNVLNLESTTSGNYILKFSGTNGSHLKSFIIVKI